MRTHPFRVAVLTFAGLLLSVLPARAGIHLDPFSDLWELGVRPASGKVTVTVEHTYHAIGDPDEGTRLPPEPQENVQCNYEDGRLVSRSFPVPQGTPIPLATVKYDDQGRKVQVVTGLRTEYQRTETVTYDDLGNMTSVTLERKDQPKVEVPITTQATAEGGRKMSWQLVQPGSDTKVDCVATFNKAGQLTALSATRDGKPVGPSERTIKYNDHGDLATYQEVAAQSEVYDYKYDAQGNWTEKTTTIVARRGDKETKALREKTVRQITYAK